MKVFISVTKADVEAAVERYIDDRLRAGYAHDFSDKKISFSNKDGALGYFECTAEVEVIEPGKDEK